MIYFLVNNNYHFLDTLSHLESLKNEEKVLIQIPHTLNILENHPGFSNIYTFHTPFLGAKSLFNISKIKSVEKKINTINIKKEDILFVYTEYEILNQYIIHRFKQSHASVYLIEDGGIPTYLTYSVKSNNIPFKGRIKAWYFHYILGYTFVKFLYFNHILFPQMLENYIDGVLLYLNVHIERKINKYLLKKPGKTMKLSENKALFLNEKIYSYYCNKDQYAAMLQDILHKLQNNFQTVYFKFHPGETEENRHWQFHILKKYPNIHIIEENDSIETLIESYNAQYVFSFFSAALLNLNAFGVVPVYLFHLYPELTHNPVFQKTNYILKSTGYIFWDGTHQHIKQVGFQQKNHPKTSLKDFIENMRQYTKRK